MLVMEREFPSEAAEEAADYAFSCFGQEGRPRPFGVPHLAFEVFVADGVDLAAMHPEKLVRSTLRFTVLENEQIVGFVTVDCNRQRPLATMMDVVEAGSPALEALLLADASADRPGRREIRVIEIPIVDAAFYWVTGTEPVFVDQITPRIYGQSQFMAELARRLDNKRRFEPDPDPDHGSQPMPDDPVEPRPELDYGSDDEPEDTDVHSPDDPADLPKGGRKPGG